MRVFLVLAVSMMLLFGSLSACASGKSAPSDVAQSDVAAYAEDVGVEIDVAAQNLALQEAAGRLEGLLTEHEPATFAGAWIEHVPAFHVVVLLTDPAIDIGDDVAAVGLEGRVEIRPAEHSLASLEAEAATILRGEGTRPFDLSIDVVHNRIELTVTSIETLSAYLSEHDLTLPPRVVIVTVDQLARPHG